MLCVETRNASAQAAGAINSAAVFDVLARIDSAPDTAAAVGLLAAATACLGADTAVFTSFVRDDVTLASYRHLLACDPIWGLQYAENGWCLDDPWLRYALYNTRPIRSVELPPLNERERWVVDGASHFGFGSVLIVPVPSPAAQSRVGVLCLGSVSEHFFEGEAYPVLRMHARNLGAELGEWMQRRVRAELMVQAHITEEDLLLLRHQQQGHSSKVIAQALHTEARTIDCRFQRLSLKLGAANRRSALRVAEIYGLI